MLSANNKVSNLTRVAFLDGTCEIYTLADSGRQLKEKLGTFYFKEDTIGIKSFYYSLHVEDIKIDRTISIPYNKLIDKSKIVVIGDECYSISLIQPKDTCPKSLKLTLTATSIKWRKPND